MLAVAVALAPQTRLYRSFFLDEIGHDYVRTARAKGLTEKTILLKHVMRNAMIPILTNIAVGAARHLRRLVPDRGVLLDPGPRPRGAARRQPQRLSGDPGVHDLPRGDHDGRQPRHRRALQARRSARGAEMSAVIDLAHVDTRTQAKGSESVWRAAWQRFARDRVGMVSLAIVALFLLLVARRRHRPGRQELAGRDRRAERAADVRRPARRRTRPWRSRRRPARMPTSRPSIRSRRATRSGPRRAKKYQTTAASPGRDAALRRRPPRPRRARQGRQGRADLDPRRRRRGLARDADRHRARRARGLLRRQGRRLARVGLQRLHGDPGHPADLRLRRGLRPRHRLGRADPRPDRLDRHLPPGPRRVHQALGARLRARGRGDRRGQRLAHVPPHPAQRQPRRARAAVDPTSSASSRPR